jgi:hypothetical protein
MRGRRARTRPLHAVADSKSLPRLYRRRSKLSALLAERHRLLHELRSIEAEIESLGLSVEEAHHRFGDADCCDLSPPPRTPECITHFALPMLAAPPRA